MSSPTQTEDSSHSTTTDLLDASPLRMLVAWLGGLLATFLALLVILPWTDPGMQMVLISAGNAAVVLVGAALFRGGFDYLQR